MYTNEKWSTPFDSNGNITITGSSLSTQEINFGKIITIYPNPVKENLYINIEDGNYEFFIYNSLGKQMINEKITTIKSLNLNNLQKGIYLLNVVDLNTNKTYRKKFIKE